MKKIPKQEYMADFKEQGVKHAQTTGITVAAKELGLVEQTLRNWVKAAGAGKLISLGTKPVTPEQMELSRLRAENAWLKMHVDILKKKTLRRTLRKMRCEVRLDRCAAPRLPPARHVPSAGREHQQLPRLALWRPAWTDPLRTTPRPWSAVRTARGACAASCRGEAIALACAAWSG